MILTLLPDLKCVLQASPGYRFIASTALYETSSQTLAACTNECRMNYKCWGFQFNAGSDPKCYQVLKVPVLEAHSCCTVYIKTCPGLTRTVCT